MMVKLALQEKILRKAAGAWEPKEPQAPLF